MQRIPGVSGRNEPTLSRHYPGRLSPSVADLLAVDGSLGLREQWRERGRLYRDTFLTRGLGEAWEARMGVGGCDGGRHESSHRVLARGIARRRLIWETVGMVITALLDAEAIARVSERFGVRRLRVFGSVLTDRFDPERSDVDFLVDFYPNREDRLDDYLGLKDALAEIVGCDVDLVVADAVKNPYFKKAAFGSAQDVYAA